MANCTYIDGCGSVQTIDTHGEIVDLLGLDCSSLIGASLNWEHKSDAPSQIVGKILRAKKIFSEQDCDDDRQRYFWGKVKLPYLYIMGRLFDDKKESSREVAALFQDDAEHPNETPMVGFSVEGGRLEHVGIQVKKSIARKITITVCPANKLCFAELMPIKPAQPKDDLDSIFKSESTEEQQLEKIELKNKYLSTIEKGESPEFHADKLGISPMNKAILSIPPRFEPSSHKSPAPVSGVPKFAQIPHESTNQGRHIGTTKSGIKVFSHAKVGDYAGATSSDHSEMAEFHRQQTISAPTPKEKDFHAQKMKLHTQASMTKQSREQRLPVGMSQKKQTALMVGRQQIAKNNDQLEKSIDAGSGLAAPSQLVGGAALAKEQLDFRSNDLSLINRSKEDYENWNKREEFRAFMKSRFPKMALGEIDAIGRTIAFKKNLNAEKILSRINSAYDEPGKGRSFLDKSDDIKKFSDIMMNSEEENK